VLYAISFRLLRAYVRSIAPVASRRALFRKRFWRVVWLALPVAVCVNLVTFCDTYGAIGGDGYERIGWPITFLQHGGFSYEVRFSFIALTLDVASSISMAVATALALRDGGRRLAATTARFLRGRSLTPPPRRDRK